MPNGTYDLIYIGVHSRFELCSGGIDLNGDLLWFHFYGLNRKKTASTNVGLFLRKLCRLSVLSFQLSSCNLYRYNVGCTNSHIKKKKKHERMQLLLAFAAKSWIKSTYNEVIIRSIYSKRSYNTSDSCLATDKTGGGGGEALKSQNNYYFLFAACNIIML